MTRHPISHCRVRCVGRCVAIVPRARTTGLTHGVVGGSTDIHEVGVETGNCANPRDVDAPPRVGGTERRIRPGRRPRIPQAPCFSRASASTGVSSLSRPARVPPRRRPWTRCRRGWSDILVGSGSVVVLPAAASAAGRRRTGAGHRGSAVAVVLVLLPQCEGLLSDRSDLLRGVDQSSAAGRVKRDCVLPTIRMSVHRAVAAVFVLALMAGCATTSSQPPRSAFEDIPVPSGLKYVPSKSTVIESPTVKAARLVYRGRIEVDSLAAAMRATLEANGWRQISSTATADHGITQVYEKSGSPLEVRLIDGWWYTYVEMTASRVQQ